jgi:tripartite-type tricarboxylate transporter receptor subunit TctC
VGFPFRRIATLLGAAVLSAAAHHASARDWPERPVRLIAPVSSGTSLDTALRTVAERLSRTFGTTFYVDNIVAGAGLVAAQTAARAAPDGYTFYLAGVGVIAADRHLFKSLPYDPERDFTPVAIIYDSSAFAFAVHPGLPAKSIPELIALAKAQPGKLSYGTGSVGVLSVPGAWLNKVAGTNIVAVPYRSAPQMMQDAVAGTMPMIITTIGVVAPLKESGQLRTLAVTSAERFPGWPDVPTVAETLPGYKIVGIGILVAPAATDREIVQRLNREIDRIVREPDVVELLHTLGMTNSGAGTPESVAEFMRVERENLDRMLNGLNITPQ